VTKEASVQSPVRDDRILPFTRVLAAVVTAILVTAWVVLYLWPEQTDRRFAWTVAPTMTPMLMGAGYGSAALFWARVTAGRRWHTVGIGFLPTTVFAWMLLVATLLHWEKFHHGTGAFRLWLWVYLVTPIAVPAVWAWNRRHDRGVPDAGDPPFPRAVIAALITSGVVMLAIAAWLFLFPSSAIGVWPWSLTPLTARTVAAFVALPGVAWLAIAADGRWSATKAVVETLALGLVLLLIAVARAWREFDTGRPMTWAYVGGLAGTLAALVIWFGWMERRSRALQDSTGRIDNFRSVEGTAD
jgi:hypothetical protein